ncbi:MAG TPA: AMMECR1 domain-containing protein, partial [Candidatus Sulfotelmatobacter sp.]|nr:AMMECR1 domain-containing protein [Candidatus Sulfotelmatobacter sp.]
EHGLIVSWGWKRGVLLPQVAEQFHWNARRLLEETCVKADLARDAWRDPATRVQAFTADVFSESEFPATQ